MNKPIPEELNFKIPEHLDFKKGDLLECVNSAQGSKLVVGQIYEATQDTEPVNRHTPEPFIYVTGRKGNPVGCYAWRFKKAEAV